MCFAEYWITSDDSDYNKLMKDVSDFIKTPGDSDLPVDKVFTQVSCVFFVDHFISFSTIPCL